MEEDYIPPKDQRELFEHLIECLFKREFSFEVQIGFALVFLIDYLLDDLSLEGLHFHANVHEGFAELC